MADEVYYRIPESCEDSYYRLETTWDMERFAEYVAAEAAEDYHSKHDGWEDFWPVTISLHPYEQGPELCCFLVEREFEPTFSAVRIVSPE